MELFNLEKTIAKDLLLKKEDPWQILGDIKDFIKEMKDITKSQSNLLFGYIPYQLYGAVNLIPDITKLKTTLKWSPSVNFKNGINKVIQDINTTIN